MTDKELLEFAAKAAGIRIDKSEFNGGGKGNTGFDSIGNAVLDWHNNKRWNPLTDDGDAFRLAVKCLPFHVLQYTSEDYEYCNQDGCAATRRAIVRAAAEIGKAMND